VGKYRRRCILAHHTLYTNIRHIHNHSHPKRDSSNTNPTNLGTITQYETESRGVDLTVFLNKPEAIITAQHTLKNSTRSTNTNRCLGFKPSSWAGTSPIHGTKKPFHSEFEQVRTCCRQNREFKSEQIRGKLRLFLQRLALIDFLSQRFPDGVRETSVKN